MIIVITRTDITVVHQLKEVMALIECGEKETSMCNSMRIDILVLAQEVQEEGELEKNSEVPTDL